MSLWVVSFALTVGLLALTLPCGSSPQKRINASGYRLLAECLGQTLLSNGGGQVRADHLAQNAAGSVEVAPGDVGVGREARVVFEEQAVEGR